MLLGIRAAHRSHVTFLGSGVVVSLHENFTHAGLARAPGAVERQWIAWLVDRRFGALMMVSDPDTTEADIAAADAAIAL